MKKTKAKPVKPMKMVWREFREECIDLVFEKMPLDRFLAWVKVILIEG